MEAIRRLVTLSEGGPDPVDLAGRLAGGEPPAALAAALGVEPPGLLAAVALAGLGDDLGPPLVRQPPPRPGLEAALAEPSLSVLLPTVARPSRLALAAGLLLIHDHWHASHEAAQLVDDLGERLASAHWHAIAHRREPDPSNAAYWYRRVGRSPIFVPLAEFARDLLADDPPTAARLLPRGAWDALAFIDFCNDARPGTPAERLARKLQRAEMALLLESGLGGVNG